jgi:hypothetical protein
MCPMNAAGRSTDTDRRADPTNNDVMFSGNGNRADSPNDPSCISCECGPAMNSVRQRFITNVTYLVPGGWGAVRKSVSRGWQVSGMYNAQTGFPFSITSPYRTLSYGIGGVVRPFFIHKTPRNSNRRRPQFFTNDVLANPGDYWSIPTTTSPTGIGTVQMASGNLGRNTYTGPGWWDLDFSVAKDTSFIHETKLQLRAEFFNIFHHTTFASPGGQITSSTFGLSKLTENKERQIQLAARLMF